MLQFIFTNLLMISLGVILYVMVRAVPRLEEISPAEKKGMLERWIASEMPEKIDAAMNSFLAKFLRKLKVLLLKVDNALSNHLRKIKPEINSAVNGGVKTAIDFKKITDEKHDEDSIASGENLSNNQ